MYKPNPVAGILAIILLASLIFGGPILFFIVACILAVINFICFCTHSSSKNKVSKQELDELIRQRNVWLKKEWPKIRENLHKNKH